MRILYHHRTRGKGAEGVHIRSITDALRARGHEVDILSFPGADPEVQAADTTPLTRTTGARGPWRWLSDLSNHVPEWIFEVMELAYNVPVLFRLPRKVSTSGPYDLVYERYSLFMFASIFWTRRHGIPVVLEINDSALVVRVRPLMFRRLATRIERWCFRNVVGLVFISGYFQRLADQTHPNMAPSVVSPNAADPELFKPDPGTRERIREAHGLTGKLVCGYVGAFIPWHGIDLFVERLIDGLQKRPEVALLLVGDGVTFERVRRLRARHGLGDQIVLTGQVPHADVSGYICAMDFGILPKANAYQSPLKLFEFMAVGCPMLCPDSGPIAEVLSDGVTGWTFPAGDIDACIAHFWAVVGRNDHATVGNAARAFIKSERQWVHNVDQFMTLLASHQLPPE